MSDFLSQQAPGPIDFTQESKRSLDVAAQKFTIAERTGRSPAVLPDDKEQLDEIDNEYYSTQNIDQIVARTPALARWRNLSPEHAEMLGSDEGPLSAVENLIGNISSRFEQGKMNVELSEIAGRIRGNSASEDDYRRRKEIKKELATRQEFDLDYGIKNWFAQVPGAAAEMIPIQMKTLEGGLATGAAGAALGLIGGVPFAPLAGFGYGMAIGGAKAIFDLESNLMYEEQIDAIARGEVDRGTADAVSTLGGMAAASLEFAGQVLTIGNLPLLKNLTRLGIRRALTSKAGGKALVDAVKGIATATAGEGITEASQEVIAIGADYITKELGAGREVTVQGLVNELSLPERQEQIAQAGKAGAQAALGLGIGGRSLSAVRDIKRYNQAAAESATLQRIVQAQANSKLIKSAPDAMKQVVDSMGREHGVPSVYVNAKKLQEHLTNEGSEHGAEAVELTGMNGSDLATAANENNGAGRDIPIPLGTATVVAGRNESFGSFLENNSSLTPGALTVAEAQEQMEATREAAKVAPAAVITPEAEAQIEEIRKNTRERLGGLGTVESEQVDDMADMVAGSARAFAMRGVDIVKNKDVFNVNFGLVDKGTPADGSVKALDFPSPPRIILRLRKGHSPSTLIHEMGHVFHAQMTHLLLRGENQLAADMQAIGRFVGAKTDEQSLGLMGFLTENQTEKFADAFVEYVRTGEAPTKELRGVFSRFRRWIAETYRSWARRRNRVEFQTPVLDDSIRGVFSRILAVEESVSLAEVATESDEAFAADIVEEEESSAGENDPKTREFFDMADAIDEAKTAAREELTKEVEEKIAQQRLKWWKEERKKLVPEIIEDLMELPVYQALESLHNRVKPEERLSRTEILQRGGEKLLHSLPKSPRTVYVKQGQGLGVPLEVAAGIYNFESVEDMLEQLSSALPIKAQAEQLADEQLMDEHGNPLDPESLREEAEEKVNGKMRTKLLRRQLQILVQHHFKDNQSLVSKLSKKLPGNEQLVEQSKTVVREVPISELKPKIFLKHSEMESRRALREYAKGDFEQAFEHKLNQLRNLTFYQEAKKAEKLAVRRIKSIRRFTEKRTRKAMARKGENVIEEIDNALAEWGIDSDGSNFEDAVSLMSTNDIEELSGALRGIEKAASAFGERSVRNKSIAAKITASMKSKAKILEERNSGMIGRLFGEVLDSQFSRDGDSAEFAAIEMDGEERGGPFHTHIFQPIADAQSHEAKLSREVGGKFIEILKEFGMDGRRKLAERRNIPGVGSMTGFEVINVAFNSGNPHNLSVMLEGHEWTTEQHQAIIDSLEEYEIRFVQSVFDFFDEELWPLVRDTEFKANGTAPPKVQAQAFSWRGQEFRGGYAPIIADGDAIQSDIKIDGTPFSSPMTQHSHAESRKSNKGRLLHLKDLTWVGKHVNAVLHDASHRIAVMDVAQILNDPQVSNAIRRLGGKHIRAVFKGWLEHVAKSSYMGYQDAGAKIMQHFKTGSTITMLGMKVSTAVVQPLGMTLSSKEIGVKWMGKGLSAMFSGEFGTPADAIEWVHKQSEEMRDRNRNIDRDVRDMMNRYLEKANRGELSAARARAEPYFFKLLQWGDMTVSVPTWIGAHKKAMAGKVKGIPGGNREAASKYADSAVRLTQGSSAPKDLSQYQRSPVMQYFTMFYQFWGIHHRQMKQMAREYRYTGNVGDLVTSIMLAWIIPAMLEPLLLGRGPDPEDDSAEDWLKWGLMKEASYPINGLVIGRDLVWFAEKAILRRTGVKSKRLTGRGFLTVEPSPAFTFLENAAKTGEAALKIGTDKEWTKTDARRLSTLIGQSFHLPMAQAFLTGNYVLDVFKGNEEVEKTLPGVLHGAYKATLAGSTPK